MAPTKSKRPTERLADIDKAPRIEKLRDQGKTWSEIAEKLKMTPGRAQFLLLAANVKPKDRIKFTDDADLAKKIVEARDKDSLSWPVIAARTGVTEGRVKDIYRRVKAGGPIDGRRKKATKTKTTKAKAKPKAKAKAKTTPAKKRRVKKAAATNPDPSTS